MTIDLKTRSVASHGNFAHFGLDKYLFTGQVTSIDADFDKDMADGAGLGSKVENNLPGIAKGNFKIDALFSEAMERQMAPFKNRQSPVYGWVAQNGLAEGSPITMMPASVGKYSSKLSKKDEVSVSFELGARGDFHEGVVMLSPKTLLTEASGTGTEDDNTDYGGATTYGGGAYLFVWDITGGTTPSITASIEHSADGDTYTNLCTFAAASVGTKQVQFVSVPNTTTVKAFTRVSWTATGSPTGVQALIGFGRDYDPSL
jgi:hypothetical protein